MGPRDTGPQHPRDYPGPFQTPFGPAANPGGEPPLLNREDEATRTAEGIKTLREFLASMMEEAKSYTRTVITVGYAALFAVWAFEKDLMSHRVHAIVGFLALVSAAVFVLYEVGNMMAINWFLISMQIRDRATATDAGELIKRRHAGITKVRVATAWVWGMALSVALLTGLAAFTIMGWQLARALYCDL